MITIAPQPAARVMAASVGPPELYVCPFTILESNAEQLPWTFQSLVIGGKLWVIPRKRQYMKTADYSIEGFEDQILIERKADDFVSSITTENARFRREHERMAAIVAAGGFAAVIIESDMAAICRELDDPLSERRVSSETVIGIVATWPRRFGVHWLFSGDRRHAERLAFGLLYKWWSENGCKIKEDQ